MGRVEREEKKKGVESGTTLSAKGGKGKWREESRKLEREEEEVSLDFFFRNVGPLRRCAAVVCESTAGTQRVGVVEMRNAHGSCLAK